MGTNLKVSRYNDGTFLEFTSSNTDWSTALDAYCWYNNDANYYNIYGGLYNWHAVHTGKLCPTGWHIPSDEEWKTLEMYLGVEENELNNTLYRGTNEGGKLKELGMKHWTSPNTGTTNELYFTALPGGVRYDNGEFSSLGICGYFWTSSEEYNFSWYRGLEFNKTSIYRIYSYKAYGLSVRCIKDSLTHLN
jgi:uncharacterized protein (TIGR02145 family)